MTRTGSMIRFYRRTSLSPTIERGDFFSLTAEAYDLDRSCRGAIILIGAADTVTWRQGFVVCCSIEHARKG